MASYRYFRQFAKLGLPTTGLVYCSFNFFGADTKKQYKLDPNIKYFTTAEVAANKSLDSGTGKIYVSRGKNVYDITKFIEQHPGGSKILLAAGKSIDPFWNHYRQHLHDHVFEILEQYKIGELSDFDQEKWEKMQNSVSPYINDPERLTELFFHSHEPCNCEANLELADEDENVLGPLEYITPNMLFFIRNHHPVPEIDLENYSATILGQEFSFADLTKNFKKREVTTTIQCGGNRRKEYNTHGKTSGTAWLGRAISTAKWEGVWLRDVILSINPKICEDENLKQNKWVRVKSNDDLEISIPIEKVLNPNGDVMLAFQMNGEEIPRDHGYPVRLIVPGYAGIRNVKWVKEIEIVDQEVETPWQTGIAYKMLPHYSKKATKEELATLKTTLESPITSYITSSPEKIQSSLKNLKNDEDFVEIYGYAWSGGGRGIQRVEVSTNGGEDNSWRSAELLEGKEQNPYKAWAWTFWKCKVYKSDILEGKLNLCCRAVDMGYNTQPRDIKLIWNLRGINNNSWHFLEIKDL